MDTTTPPLASIGIDIGKEVFHIVGFSTDGKIVLHRKIKRLALTETFKRFPTCVVGMEACLSAHFVSRALRQLGHEPRIIPAIYVKPFVKGQKNDYNDAEAIAEAALRPNLRVVREKTQDQLDLQALHRVRSRLVSRRTATINQIRAFLIEQRHRCQSWSEGPAQLSASNFEEPARRDIATNARPDRWSLRRLDIP
jgi:transposase